MRHHRIQLKHFDLVEGKISFSKLAALQSELTALAESSVLHLIEGHSRSGQGKKPGWLKRVVDFQLTGVNKGSTLLDIEAPVIREVYPNNQMALFDGKQAETLMKESAFGLVSTYFDKAIKNQVNPDYFDKYLLRKFEGLQKLLENENSIIDLISFERKSTTKVSINKSNLQKISIAEGKIPESQKMVVEGTLDVMRHRSNQLEIVTFSGQRIRTYPGESSDVKELHPYFGEMVKITGWAHFSTDYFLKAVEIINIQKIDHQKDIGSYEEMMLPIFEDLDLKQLAYEQQWRGFDKSRFRETIEKLNIKESPDELLELLRS